MMRVASLILIATLSIGCSKKKAEPKDVPKKEVAEVPEKSAKDTEKEALDKMVAELKTEEDFEDEAEAELNAENLRAEVDKLEKEMEAEEGDDSPAASSDSQPKKVSEGAKPAGTGGAGVKK